MKVLSKPNLEWIVGQAPLGVTLRQHRPCPQQVDTEETTRLRQSLSSYQFPAVMSQQLTSSTTDSSCSRVVHESEDDSQVFTSPATVKATTTTTHNDRIFSTVIGKSGESDDYDDEDDDEEEEVLCSMFHLGGDHHHHGHDGEYECNGSFTSGAARHQCTIGDHRRHYCSCTRCSTTVVNSNSNRSSFTTNPAAKTTSVTTTTTVVTMSTTTTTSIFATVALDGQGRHDHNHHLTEYPPLELFSDSNRKNRRMNYTAEDYFLSLGMM